MCNLHQNRCYCWTKTELTLPYIVINECECGDILEKIQKKGILQSQNSQIILCYWPYFYFNINLWYPLFWNELAHRFLFQYTAPSQKNIPLCHSTPYSYSMVLGIQYANGILVKYWCLGIKLLSHIQRYIGPQLFINLSLTCIKKHKVEDIFLYYTLLKVLMSSLSGFSAAKWSVYQLPIQSNRFKS